MANSKKINIFLRLTWTWDWPPEKWEARWSLILIYFVLLLFRQLLFIKNIYKICIAEYSLTQVMYSVLIPFLVLIWYIVHLPGLYGIYNLCGFLKSLWVFSNVQSSLQFLKIFVFYKIVSVFQSFNWGFSQFCLCRSFDVQLYMWLFAF